MKYVRDVTLQSVQTILRTEKIKKDPFQEEELTTVETGHWSKAPKAYELVSHEFA